jgi:hypothetical protein
MKGFRLLPDALPARIEGVPCDAVVARLSPEDVELQLPRAAGLEARQLVSLRLHGSPALRGHLESVQPSGAYGAVRIYARLVEASIEDRRDLLRVCESLRARRLLAVAPPMPAEEEIVRAPERVRAMLSALVANRCRARLFRSDGGRPIRLGTGPLDPESDMPLRFEPEGPWPEPPFNVAIDAYLSLMEMRVNAARQIEGFLAMPLPSEIRRVRTRWERRVPAPAGVVVTFSHPLCPSLTVRRPVCDLSMNGLGLSASAIKDLLYPGLILPRIDLAFGHRRTCRLSAEVRHISDDIDGAGELVGLRIAFSHHEDRAHYEAEVRRLLYPNTRDDATWSRQLWDLYGASGYLNLSRKQESDFETLRESFAVAATRFAGTELGCQVVWPSSRGVEASLSVLRTYEHGAFIFQLARRPGRVPMRFPGRAILRDVYLHAIEQLMRWDDVRWLIGWVQKEARFSRLVHVDFPARYRDSGRAIIERFHAFEVDGTAPAPQRADGIEVGPATSAEADELLSVLSLTRKQPWLEAHDLLPEAFSQWRLKRRYRDAGLERDRALLVARRGARALAACVLEEASEGLHLFRLLDVVRLFALTGGGEAAYPALIEAARGWYSARRKQKFVCAYDGPEEHARFAGMTDLGEADLVLLPAQLLPELLEHVHEVTAPRDVARLPL